MSGRVYTTEMGNKLKLNALGTRLKDDLQSLAELETDGDQITALLFISVQLCKPLSGIRKLHFLLGSQKAAMGLRLVVIGSRLPKTPNNPGLSKSPQISFV